MNPCALCPSPPKSEMVDARPATFISDCEVIMLMMISILSTFEEGKLGVAVGEDCIATSHGNKPKRL